MRHREVATRLRCLVNKRLGRRGRELPLRRHVRGAVHVALRRGQDPSHALLLLLLLLLLQPERLLILLLLLV